jgi:hypothetical protein
MTTSCEYAGHQVEIGGDNRAIKKRVKWTPWVKIDGVRQVIPDAEEFSTKDEALIYAKAKADKMIDAGTFLKPVQP